MDTSALREKLSNELGLMSFSVPGERRPILLDAILQSGLKTLRPNLPPEAYRALRMQIVATILALARPDLREELEDLRQRLKAMEKIKAPEAPTLNEAEVQHIRTLHQYGMRPMQLAKLYHCHREVIARILKRRDLPVIVAIRLGKMTKGRALYLG